MNQLTKFSLNLMQKARLDYFIIRLINKKSVNHLMLKYCWQNKNYDYFYQKYSFWQEVFKKNSIDLTEKAILEVGSGASIGLGYFFLKHGYKSWLATDFFQDLSGDVKAMKREIKLIDKITSDYNTEVKKQIKTGGQRIIFNDKINFKQLNLFGFNPEFKEKFEMILSINVLEHLEEEAFAVVVKNFSKYLKPGSLMIHEIDLRDHINVANPHGFFKYDKATWNKLTRGTIFYTNRLMLKDYLEIFKKNNFKVKFLETEKKPLAKKNKIDAYFKNYPTDELEITRIYLILELTK